MKRSEQVYRWMTPLPHVVARDATMAQARSKMRKLFVRHLPVVDAGELVGLVSESDLSFVERFVDARTVPVGDVMRTDPFVTVPYAPLAEVAQSMAERRLDAAIVIDRGNVVGLFTATDALRALAERRDERERREPLAQAG
jgi:acetoin utilization protein AcuB